MSDFIVGTQVCTPAASPLDENRYLPIFKCADYIKGICPFRIRKGQWGAPPLSYLTVYTGPSRAVRSASFPLSSQEGVFPPVADENAVPPPGCRDEHPTTPQARHSSVSPIKGQREICTFAAIWQNAIPRFVQMNIQMHCYYTINGESKFSPVLKCRICVPKCKQKHLLGCSCLWKNDKNASDTFGRRARSHGKNDRRKSQSNRREKREMPCRHFNGSRASHISKRNSVRL